MSTVGSKCTGLLETDSAPPSAPGPHKHDAWHIAYIFDSSSAHLCGLMLTLLGSRLDSSGHLWDEVIMQAGELCDHACLALQQQLRS